MLNAIVHFYETPGNCGENLNEKFHCHGNFFGEKGNAFLSTFKPPVGDVKT